MDSCQQPPAGGQEPPPASAAGISRLRLRDRFWLLVCRWLVRVFYRQVEVQGLERLPAKGPFLLCANHASAMADFLLLQSTVPRVLHPLARSGLFSSFALRPFLSLVRAVPVYRRIDGVATTQNADSFARCYELLRAGGALVIFPEGISHSHPQLQPLKTGAARIALGSYLNHGPLPPLVPAGLTFVEKGRFRGRVLIQFGAPLELGSLASTLTADREAGDGEPAAEVVRQVTGRLEEEIKRLTLNVDDWRDLLLLRHIERFFQLRRGRRQNLRRLGYRFRAYQRLIRAHRRLRAEMPEELAQLRRRLTRFQRLSRRFGVKDYHLSLEYRPRTLIGYLTRLVAFLLLLPVGLYGLLNNGIPLVLVGRLGPGLASRYDQHETSKILVGILAYPLFWSLQAAAVWQVFGRLEAVLYVLTLPPSAALAHLLLKSRAQLSEQRRVFLLFWRQRELKDYLLAERRAIENEVARIARRAKRLPADPSLEPAMRTPDPPRAH